MRVVPSTYVLCYEFSVNSSLKVTKGTGVYIREDYIETYKQTLFSVGSGLSVTAETLEVVDVGTVLTT